MYLDRRMKTERHQTRISKFLTPADIYCLRDDVHLNWPENTYCMIRLSTTSLLLMGKTEHCWLLPASGDSPSILHLKRIAGVFSIHHSIAAAIAKDSTKSKGVKHLADGCGLEPLRAGRDVEFVVLILLLQDRRRRNVSTMSLELILKLERRNESFFSYPAAK